MRLKRRAFLQRLGLVLAAANLSEVGLSVLSDRYYQALAQPDRRKLAFLVGINQYPRTPLYGCVTDVELQRELLLYRFGFRDADILTLTDQQATRQNIETAFQTHLIEQAKAGDVVVFHFSGYGGLVATGTGLENGQTSLVPVDGMLAEEDSTSQSNHILEDTLFLLLKSLPTSQVTTVLDSSYIYTGDGLQGNFRVRSRPSFALEPASEAELAFQAQLLEQLKIAPEKLQKLVGQMPGVVLAAAEPHVNPQLLLETATPQKAFENQWNGFSAGLFTYALTQTLWQTAPPTTLNISLGRVGTTIAHLSQAQPVLSGQKSRDQSLSPYYVALPTGISADGVVTAIEDGGKVVRLWLGGLPTAVLDRYEANSIFTVAPIDQLTSDLAMSQLPIRLQLSSRDGLTAKARICCTSDDAPEKEAIPVQVGQLIQEEVRSLPRNINLTVALDGSLERIERVDAISAFSAIPRVSSVLVGESADYLFGKVLPAELQPTQVAALPSANVPSLVATHQDSYGLFSPGRSAILSTVGSKGEAVKSAVKRLAPTLQALLASKLLSLTANEHSSRLGINAQLETPETGKILLQQVTGRSPKSTATNTKPMPGVKDKIPTLSMGSRIQYRVRNDSDRPVYVILLGIEGDGKAIAFYTDLVPPSEDNPEAASLLKQEVIAPGDTAMLPRSSTSVPWVVRGASGWNETLLICSTAPFAQTFAMLSTNLHPGSEVQPISQLSNPLDIAQAVLQDLNQTSDLIAQYVTSDSYALDVNHWATLRFTYQVV
jgi:hypothetical protein